MAGKMLAKLTAFGTLNAFRYKGAEQDVESEAVRSS
jgi:hypothetical protein